MAKHTQHARRQPAIDEHSAGRQHTDAALAVVSSGYRSMVILRDSGVGKSARADVCLPRSAERCHPRHARPLARDGVSSHTR